LSKAVWSCLVAVKDNQVSGSGVRRFANVSSLSVALLIPLVSTKLLTEFLVFAE